MIASLLHEGQSLVVQVTKDPIGTKGARLTTHLSIPSRYLVYMPQTPHVGVSQRIEQEGERERLKALVNQGLAEVKAQELGGFILRTAAEGVGSEEILADKGAIEYAKLGDARVLVCDAERLNHYITQMLEIDPTIFSDIEPLSEENTKKFEALT